MKIDSISNKKISLGSCIISETDEFGIYKINDEFKVASIDSGTIITGEMDTSDIDLSIELDLDLLDKEVRLIKLFDLGNKVAYRVHIN